MKTNKDIKKEINITKKLGAKKFQKIVYKVEKIKFYLLKNQLSFLVPKIENGYKKERDKLLSKVNTQEQIDLVNKIYKRKLILFRKELSKEESRNYHFGVDTFKEFKDYLLWNKKVHMDGVKNDLIAIFINVLLLVLLPNIYFYDAILLLICDFIKLVIDFECVNLQNYHLARFNIVGKKMQEKQKKKIVTIGEKYREVINEVDKQIENSVELPELEKKIFQMKREELIKLRELLVELTPERELKLIKK